MRTRADINTAVEVPAVVPVVVVVAQAGGDAATGWITEIDIIYNDIHPYIMIYIYMCMHMYYQYIQCRLSNTAAT